MAGLDLTCVRPQGPHSVEWGVLCSSRVVTLTGESPFLSLEAKQLNGLLLAPLVHLSCHPVLNSASGRWYRSGSCSGVVSFYITRIEG